MASNPFGFGGSSAATPQTSQAPAQTQGQNSAPTFNNGETTALPQFNNGDTGGGEKITDYAGSPLLIRPRRFEQGIQTDYGVTDAVEADWIILDGSDGGAVHTGMVFSSILVKALHRYLESPNPLTLGVIGQGTAKPGKSAPWLLNPLEDQAAQSAAIQAGQAAGWF